MKKSEFTQAVKRYKELLKEQTAKGSTSSMHRLLELFTRNAVNVKGISSVKDVRVRPCDVYDALTKRFGRIEIKGGSGAVLYGTGLTLEDAKPENIYPNIDYVLWSPFMEWSKVFSSLEFNDEEFIREMCKNTLVFTRNQFVECLTAIGKNGLRSSLKVSKNGHQLNIQTISYGIESRLFDWIENNGIDTLENVL